MSDIRIIFFGHEPIPFSIDQNDPPSQGKVPLPNSPPLAKKGLATYTISKDPSKKWILSKGMIGKTYRCYLHLTFQGYRIADAKTEAAAFPTTRKKEYKYWFKAQHSLMDGDFEPKQKKVNHTYKAILPEKYSVKELRAIHAFKSRVDRNCIRDQAIVEGYSRQVRQELTSGDDNVWRSMRVERNPSSNKEKFSILHGAVTPTNERAKQISTGLNNLYYHIDENKHLTITCGIISSIQKADELLEAIRLLREENPHLAQHPIRFASRSLNSFGNEAKLIKQQHRCTTYLNQQLLDNGWSDGFAVAHQNRAMNGFASVPFEKGKSDKLNTLGLAIQVSWFAEDQKNSIPKNLQPLVADIKNLAEESQRAKYLSLVIEESRFNKKRLKQLQKQQQNCWNQYWEVFGENEELEEELDRRQELLAELIEKELAKDKLSQEDKDDLKQLKKDASLADKQLRSKLKEAAAALNGLQIKRNPDAESRAHSLAKIIAYNTGMETQLGMPKLSNAQKQAFDFLYDLQAGQSTQINCKSGLDRTGFARALQNTLVQKLGELEKSGSTRTEAIEELQKFILGFEDEAKRMEDARKAGQRLDEFEEIIDFQNRMFHEIMIALVITGRSTNVLGLKWGHDKKWILPISKNSHPLPYIPYEVLDEESGKLVQLKVGESKDLTEDGQAILNGLSQQRGG